MIIDIHTHAFPNKLAERAIPALEKKADVKAHLDGRISSLVTSMDRSDIDLAVVASIATKPSQFQTILAWSEEIRSHRLLPFPSVHPEDKDIEAHLQVIADAGFHGIKLHPYYQEFSLDEPRMMKIFRSIEKIGLILLLHTGYDIAYERIPIADPEKIAGISHRFPELRMVTTHFGAWEDWDCVEEHLLGKEIYMDTSHSMQFMGEERVKKFLKTHPKQFVVFGTDSPWGNQAADVERIRTMEMVEADRRLILGDNACKLLGL